MNNPQIEEVLNTSDDGVKSILSTILNMNIWNQSNEKLIINGINRLLLITKSRVQGLELLNLIISNCSSAVISEHGITWISHCLIKYPGDNLKELKLNTIGKIINSSCHEQEFNKRFISEYLSKIFEICLSTHNNYHETVAALETLNISIRHYGSWFSPHKLRIENFIMNFFESSSKQVIQSAALVFHYTQQVGGAGADGGMNHKTNFSTSFNKLCATVQKLFDIFFENETEIDQSDRSDQETFEFSNSSFYTQKMLHVTARRIRNLLKFISTMLLKGFPVEKEINPSDVLDIISRGTALHRCLNTANNNSLEDYQFSILLNQIQIDLLQLLQGLIVWLHANALPFTFTITRILIDCLSKSQSCSCFRTDSCYQETVYKVLGCWIRVAKSAVHTHFQTQLVKCILKDVTPLRDDVTLHMQSGIFKNKSKKAIQKAVQERIISSAQGSGLKEKLTNMEKLNRETNCLFALDTLKHLLIGTILKLQPNILQELYTCVISTLIEIQTSNTKHPYTNPNCEAKLYEVLVAFYEQDTLKVLPPLQLAAQILSTGANSSNRTIVLTCENGINILEKVCQPVCPSLFISENIHAKEVIKKSSLFIDKEIVQDIIQQKENGEKADESTNNQELEESSLNIPETTATNVSENAMCEENVENDANGEVEEEEESTKLTTLRSESSVHVIDMQIIKTCNSILESSEVTNSEDSTVNNHVSTDDAQTLQTETQVKSEILSNSDKEILQSEINTEMTLNEEPPLKKIRIEEPSDVIDGALKKEEPLQNSEDDIFEEGDDFVDQVKDY